MVDIDTPGRAAGFVAEPEFFDIDAVLRVNDDEQRGFIR
jgi:hypothetical protein